MAKAVPHSLETKGPVGHPIGHPFLPSSAMSTGVPLNPPPITHARKGEVSDSCFRNIVELFAKRFASSRGVFVILTSLHRYIRTFDRDRLALEGAYAAESTFSCRFISSSRSPLPFYLTRCNTGTLQGHSIIVQTISSLSQRVVLDPPTEPASDVTIDVLQLPDTSYFVTMLFNTVIEGAVVSVDMVFLLKDSARLAGKPDLRRMLWSPFVVMSHQIILRS